LDDLCVRFIINLPQEELQSVERICFQVEEAQWYYEDFIRPLDPDLPSLNLRNFCLRIFQHCPLLSEFSPYHHAAAFEEFLAYKTRVPVRGAIMLNEEMDEVILVKGWKKGSNWSFPRGKINKDETDLDCAIREVYEETGYDIEAAGLVEEPEKMKYIDVAIQHQHLRLYVFRGVPMDTQFEARTRKEISKIEWWKLSDLPTLKKKKQQPEGQAEDLATNANKFYMVAPFLVPLKKWISQQKKAGKPNGMDAMQHPTDNEAEELAIGHTLSTGFGALPASEDMERLLAGLRQPVAPPHADEASIQLKSLLRVPTIAPRAKAEASSVAPPAQHAPVDNARKSVEGQKAATLLALLKGGASTQKVPVPRTPMDQMIETPPVPESPRPRQAAKPSISSYDPTPTFPLPPNNDEIHSTQSVRPDAMSTKPQPSNSQNHAVAAWNDLQNTLAVTEAERKRQVAANHAVRLAEEEKTGIRYQPQLPVMNETWRQIKVQDDGYMGQASQRHVVKVLKRPTGTSLQTQQIQSIEPIQHSAASNSMPRPGLAPYQATSKVQAGTASQYPEIYRPTIPSANKLPMPRMTPHSSSLLDLFKTGRPAKAATAAQGAPMSLNVASSQQSPPSQTLVSDESRQQNPQILDAMDASSVDAAPLPPPSLNTQVLGEPKRPGSAHQAALLNLFRKPSARAAEAAAPSKVALEVPSDIVELSAVPSPGHAKGPSKAGVKIMQAGPNATSSKATSVQKRPRVDSRQGKPPVSATVSGPLNVPQFEMIARKSKESGQSQAPARETKNSPVRILARPASAKIDPSPSQPEQPDTDGQPEKSPAIPPPSGLDPEVNKPPAPKAFQPQILRRPQASNTSITATETNTQSRVPSHTSTIQRQPPNKAPPAPSPHTRETPSPLSASDRRPSITKPDHKATLLSLFTRTGSPIGSPRPDLSAFVSPVTAKPPISFPLPAKDVKSNLPRSTMGNQASDLGREKPKKMTSDVDRDFLLGYLENVAKKEGR
ncbi:MAG: hypothetical protein Q9201_002073, partial [Fulgogasparrea decipioides]